VVSVTDDEALVSAISELTIELGVFTMELGTLLPFADQDQIYTGSTSPFRESIVTFAIRSKV
jgi:hypothetical protein